MINRSYIISILAVLLLSTPLSGQDFQSFLRQLESALSGQRQQLLDDFRLKQKQFPVIVNDSSLYYVCFTSAASVQIAGDETNWKPALRMMKVEGTHLWYYPAVYPADARMEYKFVYNSSDWCLDSLNPRQSQGGFGANSECVMPRYRESELLIPLAESPHGRLIDTVLQSDICKEARPVKIYFPPGYDGSSRSFPVVIYHDGSDYLKFARITTILDNLASEKYKLPVIAVFVIPVQRDPEYSGKRQEAYTSFIIQELMPLLLKRYRILPDAGSHAVSGISNGGNIALWIAARHPEMFGKVAVHSSNIEKEVQQAWKKSSKLPSALFIEIGKYDMPELLQMDQDFKKILDDRKLNCSHLIYSGGHNWNSWRNHMGEALLYLFQSL